MNTFAVIDFETTGLSPDFGDRATEVGVVILHNGKIIDRYQSLINPQRSIPEFVQSLTGITDAMVAGAPDGKQVMLELHEFVGDTPFVAHNASFDQKFLDAEFARAGLVRQADMGCSLLLSRRLYPEMPNHKLGTLVQYLDLPSQGTYHRALADAEMTAHLLGRIISDIEIRHGVNSVTHEKLRQLQRVPRRNFAAAVAKLATGAEQV